MDNSDDNNTKHSDEYSFPKRSGETGETLVAEPEQYHGGKPAVEAQPKDIALESQIEDATLDDEPRDSQSSSKSDVANRQSPTPPDNDVSEPQAPGRPFSWHPEDDAFLTAILPDLPDADVDSNSLSTTTSDGSTFERAVDDYLGEEVNASTVNDSSGDDQIAPVDAEDAGSTISYTSDFEREEHDTRARYQWYHQQQTW